MKTILLGPDNLEVDAVVPQCLDNQYVSDRVFSEMVSRGVDYRDGAIARLREKDFRTEFIRSLLYSSQVVVQRAYFKNSDFLYKNYLPEDGENLRAFAKLIREKAVVPYLFEESSLMDEQAFEVDKQGARATRALLDEVGGEMSCVRLAVDDAINAQAALAMATDFGNRIARLQFMTSEQRNAMASELFADKRRLQEEGAWDAFNKALLGMASYAFSKAGELQGVNKQLARRDIYRGMFTADQNDGSVRHGQFKRSSASDPFLLELKKYVDLVYNTNLPDRLNRYTFTPESLPSRTALQDAPREGYGHEQVSKLISDSDALAAIRRTFVAHSQKAMSLPLLRDLTVADVAELRGLPEWESFKESQARILRNPLECLERLEEFQRNFDRFQRALSAWYNRKYERPRTEESYCSYVSLAISLGGKLLVAGSNLGPFEKVLAGFGSDLLTKNIPKKAKGYAAKLMVGVYDMGKQRLDAERTYSIELMQTNAELMRDDVVALLNSVHRKAGADMPAASAQVADQGIR